VKPVRWYVVVDVDDPIRNRLVAYTRLFLVSPSVFATLVQRNELEESELANNCSDLFDAPDVEGTNIVFDPSKLDEDTNKPRTLNTLARGALLHQKPATYSAVAWPRGTSLLLLLLLF
jgi:hypothetical protein